MRITNNMLISNMMRNMNNNLTRMDKIQQQFSTGKKFQLPSDDPIGVSKSLKLNTDLSRIEQFKRNADDATSWLEITEDAVAEIGEVIKRAKELTVQAANGTNDDGDLTKISEEIKQLRDHIIKVSNTTYAGRSIFTGYKTDAPLLDENGLYKLANAGTTGAAGNVTLKENEISKYNVGVSEDIDVNVVGIRVFGKYDSTDDENGNFGAISVDGYKADGTGPDAAATNKSYIIEVFDQLSGAMDSNDSDTIQKSLERMDNVMENLLSVRAEIGAKTNRLELTQNKLSAQELNFTKLLSENEDADMAEVIMNLKIEENIYRASLSAGASIIQPTLVDFLR